MPEDTRKLFHVETEIHVLVLAESEEDARRIVQEESAIQTELLNLTGDDLHIGRADALPDGWELDTCVYHDGAEDITVRCAIAIDPYLNEHAGTWVDGVWVPKKLVD